MEQGGEAEKGSVQAEVVRLESGLGQGVESREDHKSLRPVSWTPEFTLSPGQEGRL